MQNALTNLIVDILQPQREQPLQLQDLCAQLWSHLHQDAQLGPTLKTAQPQMKYNSQCFRLFVCKAAPECASHLCCSHALHSVQCIVPLFELWSNEAPSVGHDAACHTLHSDQCIVPMSEELCQATAQELIE